MCALSPIAIVNDVNAVQIFVFDGLALMKDIFERLEEDLIYVVCYVENPIRSNSWDNLAC